MTNASTIVVTVRGLSAACLGSLLALALVACSDSNPSSPASPPVPAADGRFTLGPGEVSTPFNLAGVDATDTVEYSFTQSCGASQSTPCCHLLFYTQGSYTSGPPTLAGLFDITIGVGGQVRRVIGGGVAPGFTGVFYGDSACTASAVESTSHDTSSSITRVNLSGQTMSYPMVPLQKLGDRIYLRDVSRRVNAGGGSLLATASIEARRLHDYEPTLGFLQGQSTLPVRTSQISFVENREDSASRRGADPLVNTQRVYDFFLEKFSANSWDNAGSSMIAIVEAPFPVEDTPSLCTPGVVFEKGSSLNAFYGGGPYIYFTPIPQHYQDRGVSLTFGLSQDVAAHEWGHAYLSSIGPDLAYQRESGALNEGFADWTTVRIGHHHGINDWLVGNDYPSGPSIGFPPRNLTEARSYRDSEWLPTEGSDCVTPALCNDYCGVHSNNAIPNHMFYLLSEGGTGNQVTVTGIGIDAAYRVAFSANMSYWAQTSTFSEARSGMEMAARSLFPNDGNIERQVGNAWAAVGVGSAPAASAR